MRLGMLIIGSLAIIVVSFALAGGAVQPAVSPVSEETVVVPAPTAPVVTLDDSSAVEVFDFGYTDGNTGTPVTHVATGDSVFWFWTEGVHSVTEGVGNGLDAFPPEFDSGLKRPTDQDPTFIVSFPTPGVYEYYCTLHPVMRGVVVVA